MRQERSHGQILVCFVSPAKDLGFYYSPKRLEPENDMSWYIILRDNPGCFFVIICAVNALEGVRRGHGIFDLGE